MSRASSPVAVGATTPPLTSHHATTDISFVNKHACELTGNHISLGSVAYPRSTGGDRPRKGLEKGLMRLKSLSLPSRNIRHVQASTQQ